MAQQVQELIDKIKSEGIETAKAKSQEIIDDANKKAQEIVAKAKAEADGIIDQAQKSSQRIEASTQMALKQSSRDMLLALRKEIEAILNRAVLREISGALKADQLSGIIKEVAVKSIETKMAENVLEVAVNKKDLKVLEDGFVAQLQKELKKPIKFQASSDIGAGFTISFDEGKSCFDFTDESLANYLSNFVNTKVAELLK